MISPRIVSSTLVLALSGALSACNVFSPFDNPTSDPQLLSAARACFDQGDLSCARENYAKLSGANTDVGASESAFATLAEEGATMGALIEFVGNQADGQALTKFAERLHAGSGETRRNAIYQAFLKHTSITDTSLRAFVQFITALSLTAELLAEAAGTDGLLQKTDLAASSACAVGNTAACGEPAEGNVTSTSNGDILTNAPTGAKPSYDQLYWAITYAYQGLQNLQAGGKFGDTSTRFNDILNAAGGAPSSALPALQNAFRAQLVGTDGFNIGQ